MLWYWRMRAPCSEANAEVIGEGSAKWKMVTSPLGRRIRERTTSPCSVSSIVSA